MVTLHIIDTSTHIHKPHNLIYGTVNRQSDIWSLSRSKWKFTIDYYQGCHNFKFFSVDLSRQICRKLMTFWPNRVNLPKITDFTWKHAWGPMHSAIILGVLFILVGRWLKEVTWPCKSEKNMPTFYLSNTGADPGFGQGGPSQLQIFMCDDNGVFPLKVIFPKKKFKKNCFTCLFFILRGGGCPSFFFKNAWFSQILPSPPASTTGNKPTNYSPSRLLHVSWQVDFVDKVVTALITIWTRKGLASVGSKNATARHYHVSVMLYLCISAFAALPGLWGSENHFCSYSCPSLRTGMAYNQWQSTLIAVHRPGPHAFIIMRGFAWKGGGTIGAKCIQEIVYLFVGKLFLPQNHFSWYITLVGCHITGELFGNMQWLGSDGRSFQKCQCQNLCCQTIALQSNISAPVN